MTQVSRQVLYGSSWTPFNGCAPTSATNRGFDYWRDLGFTGMLMHIDCPGTNQSPAAYRPMGLEAVYVNAQANAADMHLLLATNMHGYAANTADNAKMPFSPGPDGQQHDWLFDDAHWNNSVMVGAHTFGRWAKENNYLGVFFNEEIASGSGGWSYTNYNTYYPGHTQSEAEAQAVVRGRSWMQALVTEFPGLEYHNYSASGWPGAWSAFWRSHYTITPTAPGSPSLQNFFYKGVMETLGYAHIYIWNADFYGGQYHDTATHNYTYGGKVYDSWQWGSVQFDRDGFKRYVAQFAPTVDLGKVDIVPFIAVAPIEPGSANPNYQPKTSEQVNGQIVPSINQRPVGTSWHAEPDKPVVLLGHYAYGGNADIAQGRNTDGTPKLNAGVYDFSQWRSSFRAMVQADATTPPPPSPTEATVTVTVSDSSGASSSRAVSVAYVDTPANPPPAVNTAPVIDNVMVAYPAGQTGVAPGQLATITVMAHDLEGGALTYSATASAGTVSGGGTQGVFHYTRAA